MADKKPRNSLLDSYRPAKADGERLYQLFVVRPGFSADFPMVIAAVAATPTSVPTLSEWAMLLLSLLVAGTATLGAKRRD